MQKCVECGGSGVIEKQDKTYECRCAFVRRMASTMPAFIRRADVKPDHLSQSVLKATKKHVLVVAAWQDMKAIIKAVMIMHASKYIKITSDREIRDVYVGSKSKAARGDEDGAVYNSLEDLMDVPDLVIVRLNELSYKNKAAPGALEEAICYRVDRDKPTWLFSDQDKPFNQGSHAYSDSIADVIKSNFPAVRIPRILTVSVSLDDLDLEPSPVVESVLEVKYESPVLGSKVEIPPEPETIRPKTKPVSKFTPQPDDDPKPRKPKIRPSEDDDAGSGLSLYGSGISSSKSKFKR